MVIPRVLAMLVLATRARAATLTIAPDKQTYSVVTFPFQTEPPRLIGST
jgi:hypothetical protein